MKITIISVGKIKEKYLKDAIAEYSKRLSVYCTLNHIEVADEKAPENLSTNDMLKIKQNEGNKILSKIKDKQLVYALDLQGKQRSSEEFSDEINNLQVYGNSDIAFIIGGSLGLSNDVLKELIRKYAFPV